MNHGSLRAPLDGVRIHLEDADDLRFWTEKFGVSADELREAVRIAGTNAQAVEAQLGGPERPMAG